MADNKVIFEVQATAKGVKQLQQQMQGLGGAVDKTDKKTKNLNKTQDKNYGRQKQGLIQTANSTKNFSKLSQTIGGGSSGLVGAYATLAANVFAATAAFSALSSAAKFEQLTEGLNQLGLQSGRSLDLLAANLKEVTGAAITTEEAFRSAALGISGGFGGTELEGLAKIAKGASITLGRDLSDAFDRLTRGAIKLEPEILDELGIMVRLDDAVEQYATQLGKTAGSLTQTERRQAFMNAILEQGQIKFGEIADATDPTVYDRLGAAFGDLTKQLFGFINIGLAPVLGFLADNTAVLAGSILILGNNVAKSMLPSISNAGVAAAETADQLGKMAEVAGESADAVKLTISKQLQGFKGGGAALQNFRRGLASGNVQLGDMTTALTSVNRSIGALEGKQRSQIINFTSGMADTLKLRKQEKVLIEALIAAEQRKGKAALAAQAAEAKALAGGAVADQLTLFTAGAQGFGATLKGINDSTKDFRKTLVGNAEAALDGKESIGLLTKGLIASEAAGFKFGATLRLIGAAFFKLLLPIGILITALGILYFAYQKIFNTPEEKKYREGQEKLAKLISSLPEKVEEFNKVASKNLPVSTVQIRQYQIISNTISEINDRLKEQIKLRIQADESRPGDRDLGLNFRDATKEANKFFEDFEERVQRTVTNTGQGRAAGTTNFITETLQRSALGQGGLDRKFGEGFFDLEALKQTAKGGRKILTSLFEIQETDEYKSFLAILSGGIPEQIALLKTEFNLEDAAKLSGESLMRFLATAIDNVDKKTKLLGSSFADLQQAIKDSEKNASAFVTSLSKKTSVDALLQSFEGVAKQLTFAQETADKAFGKDSREAFLDTGKALTDVGTNLSRIIGGDFQVQYEKSLKAARNLKTVTEATYESELDKNKAIEIAQKEYDDTLVELGKQDETVRSTLATLLKMQQAELNRKQQLSAINTQLKTSLELIKKSGEGTALISRLNNQRRKLEQEQINFQKTFLRNAIGSKTVTAEIEEAFKGTVKQGEILNFQTVERLLKEGKYNDALRVANELGVKSQDIFALQGVLQDDKNKQLKDQLDILQETFEKETMLEKALLDRLTISKQLTDSQRKTAELSEQVSNVLTRGTAELSPQQRAKLEIDSAVKTLNFAIKEAEIKKNIIDAEFKLLEARVDILKAEKVISETEAKNIKSAFNESRKMSKELIDEGVNQARSGVTLAIANGISQQSGSIIDVMNTFTTGVTAGILPLQEAAAKARAKADKAKENANIAPGNFVTSDDITASTKAEEEATKAEEAVKAAVNAAGMSMLMGTLDSYKKSLAELGPDGELIASVVDGTMIMINAFSQLGQTFETIKSTMFGEDGVTLKDGFTEFNVAMAEGAAMAQFAASAIAAVSQIMAANSRAQIAEIDKQIDAEKKRDGKSKESLARITGLEKKKENVARKNFEMQKKMQMASVVMNAAAAIMQVWANPADLFKTWAPVMTGVISALAAAQLAIISKTQFAGGASDVGNAPTTALTIGGRSNAVDVSQRATGGELSYLRGGRTTGNDMGGAGASLPGAAMGRKGYANGGEGIVVGERGPEVITPSASVDITPNFALGGQAQNINFNISAVDGASVQNMLNEQQGNIIAMIRQAANDNGEGFLESVDSDVYGGGG